MMKKSSRLFLLISLAVAVLIALLVIFNFPNKISDVKNEENIGKKVVVRGEVGIVIKIGSLSGYILEDDSGSIAVSSDDLPREGEMIAVRGTLIRDTIFGYYIRTT